MKTNPLRVAFAIVLVAGLGGLAWLVLRPRETEPVYHGKPLSFWLGAPYSNQADGVTSKQCPKRNSQSRDGRGSVGLWLIKAGAGVPGWDQCNGFCNGL
jgi:hypothetical protein